MKIVDDIHILIIFYHIKITSITLKCAHVEFFTGINYDVKI